MKEVDITTYTNYFNDLVIPCPRMVTPEYKKIERYIWELPQPIQGLVTASKPTSYDSAKRLAFNLTNEEICRYTTVQKANVPNIGSKKINFGRDSKGQGNNSRKNIKR